MAGKEKTKKSNPLVTYIVDSVEELRRVTWPTKHQAIRLTALVLGFCVIAAIIIGLFDFAFSTGYRYMVENAPATTSTDTTNSTATTPDIKVDSIKTEPVSISTQATQAQTSTQTVVSTQQTQTGTSQQTK